MGRAFGSLALVVGLTALVTSAQSPSPLLPDELYSAIRVGDTRAVGQMLQRGTDVNARDRRGGMTALMHAATVGSADTMKLLIERGADVNARTPSGLTALMLAATDLAKVRLLLDRGAEVNAVTENGRTALMLSAMSDGSSDIVRALMAKGADPRAVDKMQMTTVLAAATGNDLGTIRQMLAAGADLNMANAVGFTPLMWSAGIGNLEAVKLLLSKGANANAVSGPPFGQVKNGTVALGHFTPLHGAASLGSVDLVKTLLDAGANVNEPDARGMTPLMLAAATDYVNGEKVSLLLARGARMDAKSLDGETASDWSLKFGPTPGASVLAGAGGKPTNPTPGPAMPKVPPPAPTTLQNAVTRSVPLLERSSRTFFTNGGCGACHAQNITDIAVNAARAKGVTIDEQARSQRSAPLLAQFGSTAPRLLERFDPPATAIFLYALAGFAAAGLPPDRSTDAMVLNLMAQQEENGRWRSFMTTRPPMADGGMSDVALGIFALSSYGPPARAAEILERIAKAVAVLKTEPAPTTNARGMRLLGFKWGQADAKTRRDASADLVKRQHPDGGWGQRDDMASDAFATGIALYALLESDGIPSSHPAAQRAIKYLLSQQRADGSWYVRSRAPKFQPYFDGGFPYEHDQWISSMATGWATAALAAALP